MLSIIDLRFDAFNDSFFVNLFSYAQLVSSILLQETVKNESDIHLFLDSIIFHSLLLFAHVPNCSWQQ